jgi:hypothetical protein
VRPVNFQNNSGDRVTRGGSQTQGGQEQQGDVSAEYPRASPSSRLM